MFETGLIEELNNRKNNNWFQKSKYFSINNTVFNQSNIFIQNNLKKCMFDVLF